MTWTSARAHAWYDDHYPISGCNFTPSTACNQIEMWHPDTYDPETIDRELGWAADAGMNAIRVYLHDAVWDAEGEAFLDRIDHSMTIADRHGIATMLTIFDDCWHQYIEYGPQPQPKPGVHNSRWLSSPGHERVEDPTKWSGLEEYVTAVIERFKDDPRVLAWDLYNEPGQKGKREDETDMSKDPDRTLPLLKKTFEWARAVDPSQPLTAGMWCQEPSFDVLNAFQMEHSDITTFHAYSTAEKVRSQIARWARTGRPLICTECIARGLANTFENILPVFAEHRVGWMMWGLVAGKIQTYQPWGTQPGDPEADPWHHDLFRPNGEPYDEKEIELIRAWMAKQTK